MRRILPALLLTFLLLFSQHAFANACAWVSGSTANWSSTAAWTSCGGVAPTANDTVSVSGTGTLTVDGTSGSPSLAGSVDFTGFTGTFTLASGKELDIGNSSLGSLTIVSGMTYSPSGTALIKFVSTTTGNQIKFGGKNSPALTFNGVGGGWQYQDAPANGNNTYIITLTNGALDFNGKSFQLGELSSNNGNTRSLTLGASTLTLTAATAWDITNSAGMTLSAGSSTLSIQATGSPQFFNGGGLAYGTVTDSGVTTTSFTITGANSFGALTLPEGAGNGGSYQLGANEAVTGACTLNGNSVNNRDFIRSNIKGTARTLSCATVTATYLDLQDIIGAGAASWNLASITGNSGDCGNNSGVTLTTGQNDYWTGHTGNYSVSSNWKTASGGGTTARTPLCQDTAVFDSNSFSGASQTVTFDSSASPRTGAIDFSNVTNNPTFATGQSFSFYGSITFKSGMTDTNTNTLTYEGRKNSSLTSASITHPGSFSCDATGTNSLFLADNFTDNRGNNTALIATSGIIDATASTVTLNSSTGFEFNGGTIKFGPGGATFNTAIGIGLTGGALTSNGKLTLTYTSNTAGSISVTAPPPVINPGMHGGFN